MVADEYKVPQLAEQIAAVIGGGVTAGIEVTEEEMMLPPHYPKALRELEKRAPGLTTIAEDDDRRFDADLAIVYQTALLMLDAVKAVRKALRTRAYCRAP